MPDINSYVTQQASKWVVEGGHRKKEWMITKATLKKMGIDDFYEDSTGYYDRYPKKK